MMDSFGIHDARALRGFGARAAQRRRGQGRRLLTSRARAPTLTGMEVHLTPRAGTPAFRARHPTSPWHGYAGAGGHQPVSGRRSPLCPSCQAWRGRPGAPASVLMEVRWSTPAVEDLERIFTRIEKDNATAARLSAGNGPQRRGTQINRRRWTMRPSVH